MWSSGHFCRPPEVGPTTKTNMANFPLGAEAFHGDGPGAMNSKGNQNPDIGQMKLSSEFQVPRQHKN